MIFLIAVPSKVDVSDVTEVAKKPGFNRNQVSKLQGLKEQRFRGFKGFRGFNRSQVSKR
jgi:hypothetical protein